MTVKNIRTRWTMSIKAKGLRVNQFAVLFDGRVLGFNRLLPFKQKLGY